jgi:uncharacterized membrane protein YeaQ/YmgE (transglycosylase-associated protein family)
MVRGSEGPSGCARACVDVDATFLPSGQDRREHASFSFRAEDKGGGNRIVMPDIVNLIIWLVAGIAGGNVAGELLKGDYDQGLGNMGYGAIGGVVGALILQTLIPALRGIDYGPLVVQLIVAAASGAALTVIVGA